VSVEGAATMTKARSKRTEHAKQKLPRTCILDSNILISLANPDDPSYKNVREYIEALKSFGTLFYLSSIVETEFSSNGSIGDVIAVLGQNNVRRIAYDHADAHRAKILKGKHEQVRGAKKEAHLLDMMIVAQASRLNLEVVVSADKKMLSFLKEAGIPALDVNVSLGAFLISDTPLYGNNDLKA
jgi:predicted nucleic acid-binding protein